MLPLFHHLDRDTDQTGANFAQGRRHKRILNRRQSLITDLLSPDALIHREENRRARHGAGRDDAQAAVNVLDAAGRPEAGF